MPPPAEKKTWLDQLKEWLSLGTLLSSGIGLLVGASGVVYGTYQHFAKASDLAQMKKQYEEDIVALRKQGDLKVLGLSCDLASQVYISNQVAQAQRETRNALRTLKTVKRLEQLPEALSDAVEGVDRALAKVDEERNNLQKKKTIIGGPECTN